MSAPARQPRYTVAGSAILSLLRFGDAHGVKLDALERQLGLDRRELAAPDARVSQSVSHTLWHELATALQAPHLGLDVAEHLDLEGLDVLGHLAVNSVNLRELLDRVVRYNRILHDAGRVEYEVRGHELLVFPGCRGLLHPVPRHVSEYSAALVLGVARLATRANIRVEAVAFRHPAPASTKRLKKFFGVEPTFDAVETVVTLEAKVLELPIAEKHTGVAAYLDRYAQQSLAKLPAADDGLVAEVRRLLVVGLEQGAPTADHVAAKLGMHPRTLQRRLFEENVSVTGLLEEARRTLAERLLAENRLAIGEVAFLLGYAETSAFHRAFKRWTGRTPAEQRARAVAKRR